MRVFLLGTLIAFFATQTATAFDFRRVNWGMTMAEVEKSEGKTDPNKGKKTLGFGVVFGDTPGELIYVFSGGRLAKALYSSFLSHPADKTLYVKDFWKLAEFFKKDFGDPVFTKIIWHNNEHEGNQEKWPLAVSLGHADLMARWEHQKAIVTLFLTDKKKPHMQLVAQFQPGAASSKPN